MQTENLQAIPCLLNVVGRESNPAKLEPLADYPDFLTPKHLAEITGLSEQTIRRMIHEGEIPGRKIGRSLFSPKTKFLEYMNCNSEQ